MLLIAELVAIVVFTVALFILIAEERRIKKSKIPKALVKEYWNGRERRRAKRINTSLFVRYFREKNAHLMLNGRTRDISSGGMRLLANEKLTRETLLRLELDIPDPRSMIVIDGEVIWSEGDYDERDETGRRLFNTGIQFLKIRPNDKKRLEAYIEKISQGS